MKRVLVTGGAGYIGSHTCKALAQAGYQPVVYDNLKYGHRDAVKWGELVEGDILDGAKLVDTMKKYHIEAVLHFAAFAYVGESVRSPEVYYHNNVVGSLSLLEAMRACELRKIVFSSTCATYGVPDKVPFDEMQPQNPINPYGFTKLVVERMLHDYGVAHSFESICLRYFNAAGADPDGEIYEEHEPETHLIPLALAAVYGTGHTLTVFGADYPTADGTCIRDYIHVADLAEAHVLALKAIEKGRFGFSCNLGVGRGYSVKEVVAAVERTTGRKVPVIFGDRRPGDPAQLIASNEKARLELGWKPKYTDLDEIVRTANLYFKHSC
jgi:UDP-arabinose 4-epimerase